MHYEQLDVRLLPNKEKHSTIFAVFDNLSNGESVQLVNDHDPIPIYYQFQAERPGQFHWEYLDEGPEVWKINIYKI